MVKKGMMINNTNDNKCRESERWKGGLWYKKTWKNGVWFDGIWMDGIWEDGYFVRGTWRNGTWENGIWRGGVWINGTWEAGNWQGGYWIEGFIYSAKFNKLVYSLVSPAEFYEIEKNVATVEELEKEFILRQKIKNKGELLC